MLTFKHINYFLLSAGMLMINSHHAFAEYYHEVSLNVEFYNDSDATVKIDTINRIFGPACSQQNRQNHLAPLKPKEARIVAVGFVYRTTTRDLPNMLITVHEMEIHTSNANSLAAERFGILKAGFLKMHNGLKIVITENLETKISDESHAISSSFMQLSEIYTDVWSIDNPPLWEFKRIFQGYKR